MHLYNIWHSIERESMYAFSVMKGLFTMDIVSIVAFQLSCGVE